MEHSRQVKEMLYGTLARIKELDELEKRLMALEKSNGHRK